MSNQFMNEEDDILAKIMAGIPQMKYDPVVPMVSQQEAAPKQSKPMMEQEVKSSPVIEMNPEVKKYIQEKYKISDDLSNEAFRDAQKTTIDNNYNLNMAEAANMLGNSIAGVKGDNSFYNKLRGQANQGEKSILDARKFESDTRNESLQVDKLNREQDINSEESKLAQNLAKQMLPSMNFSNLSASQINEKIPSLQKIYEMKMKQQEYALNREAQSFNKRLAMEDRNRDYQTNYGEARTRDDAKQIKAGAEMKEKFDRQLKELIELRKDKGVEYFDREAVTRGKQLSKDLLLTYKDMAKLGVLSQSDEKILNAIIPDDPLGQDMILGQDPILYKLEKFQGDANADFDSRLNNRLLNPEKRTDKKPVDQFPKTLRKGNQTTTVDNEAELKEAKSEGWN